MSEPPPKDVKRLHLDKFGSVENHGDYVEMQVTVKYWNWCCAESHELSDAVESLVQLFEFTKENK